MIFLSLRIIRLVIVIVSFTKYTGYVVSFVSITMSKSTISISMWMYMYIIVIILADTLLRIVIINIIVKFSMLDIM